MSQELKARLFGELESIVLIDPHTHINPHSPASKTLADILGYHYYTELAHSAGLERAKIEEPGLDPKEKVRRLVEWLAPLENTVQYSWLLGDVPRVLRLPGRPDDARPIGKPFTSGRPPRWPRPTGSSRFSTRAGWSRSFSRTISTIRSPASTRRAISPVCGPTTWCFISRSRPSGSAWPRRRGSRPVRRPSSTTAVGKLFDHFTQHGARACAISLPPDFEPDRRRRPSRSTRS